MKITLVTTKQNWTRKVDVHEIQVSENSLPLRIGFLAAVLQPAGNAIDIFDRYCSDKTSPSDNFTSQDFMGQKTKKERLVEVIKPSFIINERYRENGLRIQWQPK